jgi:hypothetical protein
VKNFAIKRLLRKIRPESLIWAKNGYPVPVPFQIKLNTLLRNAIPNSDWIETGTYLAETTVALAKNFPQNRIYTIEPARKLYEFSSKKYSKYKNIDFILGTSEQELEKILINLTGSVNFWLDGHYSGDVTYKGEIDSPIITELKLIESHKGVFKTAQIFIDDFRLFGSAPGYPSKEELIDWAVVQGFNWTVENDIFCCRITS